ncbi:MAG: hypothetical protein V3U11_04525, partial [Planctomycetota bacterium]
RRAKGDWKQLGTKAMGALDMNQQHAFQVTVGGGKMAVQIRGKMVLTCGVDGRDMKGPWGLGAQAGSAGIWQGLECVPK